MSGYIVMVNQWDDVGVIYLGPFSTEGGARRKADAINKLIDPEQGADGTAWAYVYLLDSARLRAADVAKDSLGIGRGDG